jgi:hypothetical protein
VLKLPARVAQLVEQLICNQLVGGSSPFSGSKEAEPPEIIRFEAGGIKFRVMTTALNEAEPPEIIRFEAGGIRFRVMTTALNEAGPHKDQIMPGK